MRDRRAVRGLMVAISLAACSGGYRSEQTDANTRVTLSAAIYPLVVGRNELALEVARRNGERDDEAVVEIRYGLPPMPGMGPVSHDVTPRRDGERYTFTADVHTRSKWTVEVLVRRRGVPESRFSFALDAS